MYARTQRFLAAFVVAALSLDSCSESAGQAPVPDLKGPTRVARDRIPALHEPRANELDDLHRFVQAMPADTAARVRVLVEFVGLVPRAADGGPQPPRDAAERAARAQSIAKAQGMFLAAAQSRSGASSMRFSTLPFLLVELTRVELGNLEQWITGLQPNSTQRPFRIHLERERRFKGQSAPALVQDTPIATVLERLEFKGTAQAGAGPVVAIIDNRIRDDGIPLLQDRIEAREAFALGYPNATADEPPVPAATPTPNHGTQVALVVAASDPWPRILALRCDDGGDYVTVPYVAQAIESIVATWADTLGPRLCAVAMSLGEDDCASLLECSCWGDLVNDDGISHANLIISAIADLDAKGIPIVLPAGNSVHVAGAVAFPACITSAVTVGATNAARFSVSDQSAWGDAVDFCAPGYGVQIDWGGSSLPVVVGPGTSISVPFVATAIALLRATHPGRPLDEIEAALELAGTPIAPRVTAQTPQPLAIPEIRLARAAALLDLAP